MDVKIRQALTSTGYTQLTRLRFQFDGSTIILTGTVDTFYMKQLAQESVLKVLEDGLRLLNRIKVHGKVS